MNKITIVCYIEDFAKRLKPFYDCQQNALMDAWWLVEWATQKSRTYLIAHRSFTLNYEQQVMLQDAEAKIIKQRMPLAYIIGTVPFLDLTLAIKPPILIPRPETEYWCNLLIQELKRVDNQHFIILDLCTGSGCIALSLAQAFKKAHVYGIDINPQALELARYNANLNKITNVTFLNSDLYEMLPKDLYVDFIVSNPPYVSLTEWQHLDPMIKLWEDTQALVANDNGLKIIKKIIDSASSWLTYRSDIERLNIPQLFIEIGYLQGDFVKAYAYKKGFTDITIVKDLLGQDRLITIKLGLTDNVPLV